MKILDFFRSLFTSKARAYGLKIIGSDISSQMKSEILKNVWVVAGIEAIINAIQRMGTLERDKIFDSNQYITFDELLRHIVYDVVVSGNSYLHIVMGAVFQPLEPENCFLEVKNGTISFSYLGTEIDYQEIIHFRNVIPNEQNYRRYFVGDSLLKNIYDVILLDNEILRSNLVNFQNNNFILLASTRNDILDYEAVQSLAQSLEDEIRRSGRINFVISPIPMDIQVVKNDTEAAYIQTMRENAIKILSVLRVPPIILGFGDSGNYVNRKEQLKSFYTNAVFPMASLIEGVFRSKGYSLRFNYGNIEVLQESLYEKANTLNALILAGYPLEQAAELLGLPKPVYRGTERQEQEQQEQNKNAAQKKTKEKIGEARHTEKTFMIPGDIYRKGVEVKEKFYRGHVKFSEEFRKKLLATITTYRNYFYDEYMEKLMNAYSKGNLVELDSLLNDFILNVNHLFQTTATEWFSEILNGFKEVARLQLGTDIFSTTLVDLIAAKHGKKITRINDTIRAQIMEKVSEGIQKGTALAEIGEQIRGVFNAQRSRANTIARTEVTSVLNDFSHSEAYQRGMEWKIWLTAHDEVVRPTHAELDYVKVSIQEPFILGLMYPGDPNGDASETVNCRCTLIFE